MLSHNQTSDLLNSLVASGLITHEHADLIQARMREAGENVLAATAKLKLMAEATLYEMLSSVIDYPYMVLDLDAIDTCFPFDFYIKNACVLLKKGCLAMVDPQNMFLKDAIREKAPFHQICLVSPSNLFNYLQNMAKTAFDDEVLTQIFTNAVMQNASDIHFQPEEHYVCIQFRIDGILRQFKMMLKSHWPQLIVQLKIKGGLDIAESRRPQSGRFFQVICGKDMDFRISAHPTVNGENIVVRLLEKNKITLSLTELGFEGDQIDCLCASIQKPSGIILICGPTGSGKTTTLYSLFSLINDGRKNILTLEEPVEYQLDGVRQTEIIDDCILSYADGIKSILRQDPDVIFVGEIRDETTAKMAVRASITGHLVLATLHTCDSVSAIYRLIDLGVDSKTLASNLICVIAQKLFRCMCPSCHGQKCDVCFQEGLKNRSVLAEILMIDDAARLSVAQGCTSINKPQQSFQDVACVKVQKNMTTRDEIKRVLG